MANLQQVVGEQDARKAPMNRSTPNSSQTCSSSTHGDEKFFEIVNLDLTVSICSEHLSVQNFCRFGSSSVKADP